MSWFKRLLGADASSENAPEGCGGGVPAPAAAFPDPGDVLHGRLSFRLRSVIGQGAYGTVYVADVEGGGDTMPAQVALKVLSARLSEGLRADSLRSELSSLLALDHPTIPRVYDWSVDGPHPFVAMQRHEGGSLSDMLARSGPLPEEGLTRLLSDLLDALCVASRASLLHLDIKPDNVLIRDDGGFALADFGTARAAWSSPSCNPNGGRGTRGYRAPEQIPRPGSPDYRTPDLRTDLFGIGATVWSAAAGIDLSCGRGLGLRGAHRGEAQVLPPIQSLRPLISSRLAELLGGLLMRDPAARPGDPATVRSSLGIALDCPLNTLAGRGRPLSEDAIQAVQATVLDPLWAQVLSSEAGGELRAFAPGDVLVEQDEPSHHALVLLQGTVAVRRDGQLLAHVRREGAFLGEVAALTGGVRTAHLSAEDDVVVMLLDLTALEALVTGTPAVGVRLIHAMAQRLAANMD